MNYTIFHSFSTLGLSMGLLACPMYTVYLQVSKIRIWKCIIIEVRKFFIRWQRCVAFMQVLAVGMNEVVTSLNLIYGANLNPSNGSSSHPVPNCRMWANVMLPLLPPYKAKNNPINIVNWKARKHLMYLQNTV